MTAINGAVRLPVSGQAAFRERPNNSHQTTATIERTRAGKATVGHGHTAGFVKKGFARAITVDREADWVGGGVGRSMHVAL
jgi:hypothetical protein